MERITLLSIIIFLFASIASAQITRGSVYLGGSIGGSTSKIQNSGSSEEGKSTSLSINPAVGVAVRNNLIAGVSLYYSHGKNEHLSYTQNNRFNSYGGGFFLRKYYPLSNRFYLFGESGLGYSYDKWEYLQTPGSIFTSVNKGSSVYATVFPGLAIHVTRSFYFEAAFNDLLTVGYSGSRSTSNNAGSISTSKRNDFLFQSSLTSGSYLNIGVRFIIPKK